MSLGSTGLTGSAELRSAAAETTSMSSKSDPRHRAELFLTEPLYTALGLTVRARGSVPEGQNGSPQLSQELCPFARPYSHPHPLFRPILQLRRSLENRPAATFPVCKADYRGIDERNLSGEEQSG